VAARDVVVPGGVALVRGNVVSAAPATDLGLEPPQPAAITAKTPMTHAKKDKPAFEPRTLEAY